MSGIYTPSLGQVRYWYILAAGSTAAPGEFDRMVKAVRAETWDEAVAAVFAWWSTPEDERGVVVNPYGMHPADRLMQEIEKEQS